MKLRIIVFVSIFLSLIPAIYSEEVKVKTGADVLLESNAELLAGKRVALLTNFTGRLTDGRLTAEVLSERKDCKLVKIFTPEHGFYLLSQAGKSVENSVVYGVPAISLYGSNRHPTPDQLSDVDVVVIDLQDVGVRSYTYVSTALYMTESASKAGIPVIVCDRPNPLGGISVDGNILETKYKSFIGLLPVSYMHGCTIGELVKMAIGEGWVDVSLNATVVVIKMQNWSRQMTWEDTGLMWFPTSPNVPTVNAVRGMAMTGAFGELGIFNLGIGTALPFQYFGVGEDVTDEVNMYLKDKGRNDISLTAIRFGTKSVAYGYFINFPHCDSAKYFTAGVDLALAFRTAIPEKFNINTINAEKKKMFIKATGTEELFNAVMKKATREYVLKTASRGVEVYLKTRAKYLLY